MTINPLKNLNSAVDDPNKTATDAGADVANIWSQILQECNNSTKKTPPPKSLILLGDNESGRSTLVARLKGAENVSKGIGIEYHYIDIKDEDRDGKNDKIL
jgi:ABC-type branched-subunit amino acid transport system ATPase component